MKLLIVLVAATVLLLAGAVIAPIFVADAGRVVFLFHGWRIETSVLGLLIIATLLLALGVALWWLLGLPWRARRKWQHYQATRPYWPAGVMALLEGRHDDAERLLSGKGQRGKERAAGYLLAAKAASAAGEHDQEAEKRRQRYLDKAVQESDQARNAVMLDQARTALARRKPDQTLSHLDQLPDGHEKLPSVLALRVEALWRLGRAEELPALQADIRKRLGRQAANSWQRRYLLHRLSRLPDDHAIDELWQQVPRRWRRDTDFAQAYAVASAAAGRSHQAVKVVMSSLRKHWSEPLVRCLGELPLNDPAHALKRLESLLHNHPDSPGLLATLGRLSASLELTGQARVYLRDSLRLEDDAPTCQALADLLEQEGDYSDALACWRRMAKMPPGERRTPVLSVEPANGHREDPAVPGEARGGLPTQR